MALNPSNSSNLEQLALKGLIKAWRTSFVKVISTSREGLHVMNTDALLLLLQRSAN